MSSPKGENRPLTPSESQSPLGDNLMTSPQKEDKPPSPDVSQSLLGGNVELFTKSRPETQESNPSSPSETEGLLEDNMEVCTTSSPLEEEIPPSPTEIPPSPTKSQILSGDNIESLSIRPGPEKEGSKLSLASKSDHLGSSVSADGTLVYNPYYSEEFPDPLNLSFESTSEKADDPGYPDEPNDNTEHIEYVEMNYEDDDECKDAECKADECKDDEYEDDDLDEEQVAEEYDIADDEVLESSGEWTDDDFYQLLQNNLEALVDCGKINLQARPNTRLELMEGFKNYHFYLTVPYAGRFLTWEVIFDPEDLLALPDFDFNDYFLPEPEIDYIAENIPTWDNWDLTDTDSLLNIVQEFLALYKKTHLEKLLKENKFSQLKEQYKELLREMDMSPEKIEVQIETRNELEHKKVVEAFVAINISVELPVDFSKLMDYYSNECGISNPGEDYAHLYIQYRRLDQPQGKVALHLSSRPEQALEKLKVTKLAKDATLLEYVRTFKESIESHIQLLSDRSEARSQFIAALIAEFAKSVVEYDCAKNSKITFIYDEIEEYHVLVTVKLSNDYPRDKPKIMLQSIFCQVGRTCQTPVIFYSYDGEATVEENVKFFKEVVKGEVKKLENHKH